MKWLLGAVMMGFGFAQFEPAWASLVALIGIIVFVNGVTDEL